MSTYDEFEMRADPTPKIHKKSGPFGTEKLKTVAEAVAFCERMGLDPTEVRLAHNYVLWEAPETPEEVSKRVEYWHKAQREHLAAIRRMHAEYTERGLLP